MYMRANLPTLTEMHASTKQITNHGRIMTMKIMIMTIMMTMITMMTTTTITTYITTDVQNREHSINNYKLRARLT